MALPCSAAFSASFGSSSGLGVPRVRSRKLTSGTYWYFVHSNDKEIPCGLGKDGQERALLKLARAVGNRYRERLGMEAERECIWSLADLRKADLAEAQR